ncbi:LysR family transcriptional regulator [Agathobacter sp.]
MLDFRTETFLTVCQTMNFTAAAKQLNITQPAVSQHIHFLEEQYNTSLFIYRNKQLFLTRSGEILRKHLLTMKNDEKAIMEELKSSYYGIESLSIGVTMTIGEYAIVDKLAGFLIRHPEINVHLHYGNTSQLLNLLDNGQICMAIVEGNYPKENYSHKKYSTEDYIAVCAASHNFMIDQPHSINDLVCERLLLREDGSGTRNILEQSLIARGLRISDFIHYTEVENMHTIIGLLKKDCGISFLYKIAVKNELQSGVLKEIPLNDFKMQHDFDIIWEKHSIYTEKYLSICEEFI